MFAYEDDKKLAEMLYGLGKVSARMDQLARENSDLKAENERLRKVLEKIASYGIPLEAPQASYAVCAINDIAKEALSEGEQSLKSQ
jgi:regulator of replication initiation timing